MQGPKIAKNSPSGHHPTALSGYMFSTKAHIDNRKKLVKQQWLTQMSAQYGEHRPKRLRSVGEFGAPQHISTGFLAALLYGTLVVGVSQTLRR